jgi:hypothetical protein
MTFRRRWDINTRTQIISLGPALLLTLLLISFFTFVRIQDLRQELNHTGQLIANQLAPAAEYGVISGNNEVLDSLLKATLATPTGFWCTSSTRRKPTSARSRSKCFRRRCGCNALPWAMTFSRPIRSPTRRLPRIIWAG